MNDDIALYPSRRKWLGMLYISVLFVVACYILLGQGQDTGWIYWAGIVFFGAGTIISLLQLAPGFTYLKLTSDGFEQRSMGKSWKESWQNIESFKAYDNPTGGGRMIGVIFKTGYGPAPKAQAKLRKLFGVDGALADTCGMSADQLEKELNDRLIRSQLDRQP